MDSVCDVRLGLSIDFRPSLCQMCPGSPLRSTALRFPLSSDQNGVVRSSGAGSAALLAELADVLIHDAAAERRRAMMRCRETPYSSAMR
jgi:hypothetical protein